MNSFRDVERKFVILNTPKYAALTGAKNVANSLLCYGYVDHTAGLTYETVAAAMYVGGDYSIVDTVQVMSLKIRADSISSSDVIPVHNKALFRQYASTVENIDEFYYADQNAVECRAVVELDQFRHSEFPDDIQVTFAKPGFRPEGIWVRTERFLARDQRIAAFEGIMLNTPYVDFGVKAGDRITFATIVVNDNTRVCLAMLPNPDK